MILVRLVRATFIHHVRTIVYGKQIVGTVKPYSKVYPEQPSEAKDFLSFVPAFSFE